ncbi:DUF6538 domain-containing protein [Bradyrhizobium sp. Pha-3]|uniref:DUF6538 domain-containing protein n=1 Tax=Bradyrhizobium sp. Pha-3 TaxID=208375 RepID=UPI0035D4B6C6
MALSMARPWRHPKTGVYYFRKAVPKDLRDHLGNAWERKQSLETKDQAEARRKHTEVAAQVEREWTELRRRIATPPLAELDAAIIKRAGEAYFAYLLEEDDDRRLAGFMQSDILPEEPTPTFEEYADSQAEFEADARNGWARGEVDVFYMSEVDEVLSWPEFRLRLAPTSPSRKLIARELQAAVIRAGKVKQQRNEGEPVETPPYPSVAPQRAQTGEDTLRAAFEGWKKERDRPEGTVHEYNRAVEMFIQLHGNLQLVDLRRSHARTFREELQMVPKVRRGALLKASLPELSEYGRAHPSVAHKADGFTVGHDEFLKLVVNCPHIDAPN